DVGGCFGHGLFLLVAETGDRRGEFLACAEFLAVVVWAAAAAAVEPTRGSRPAERTLTLVGFARQDRRGLFVDRLDAQGHVAQHVFIQAELTLHFGDERRFGVQPQQHVVALAVLLDPIGQAAQAPVFALLHRAALGGEFGGDVVGDLLDLLLRYVVPRDQ